MSWSPEDDVDEFGRTPRYQGAGSSQVNPTKVAYPHDELVVLLGADQVRHARGCDEEGVTTDALLASLRGWLGLPPRRFLPVPEPVLEPKDDDDPFESPQDVLRRKKADRERARLHIERHEAWVKSRDAALRRFDALGGSAQWTDAKDRWDDQ